MARVRASHELETPTHDVAPSDAGESLAPRTLDGPNAFVRTFTAFTAMTPVSADSAFVGRRTPMADHVVGQLRSPAAVVSRCGPPIWPLGGVGRDTLPVQVAIVKYDRT